MSDNLVLYDKWRSVPATAKKEIKGGRLNGFTDIQPMWRIKQLTGEYGPCGTGWYYTITDKRIIDGADGTKAAFVDIDLFVKRGDAWSMPVTGTGGSMFVALETKGLYTSDECFKMALTDAISVACKSMGMGADVYWNKDRTKYTSPAELPPKDKAKPPVSGDELPVYNDIPPVCAKCGIAIDSKVYGYSQKVYGRPLCREHQQK